MKCHSQPSAMRLRLQYVAPEHLLLLTIFGSNATQQCVEAELDRRAALRPKRVSAVPRSVPLRPAA